MQSIIIKNRKLATWFMSSRKPEFWKNAGEKKALMKFQEAAVRVPAYKNFLKEKNINPQSINDIKNFEKLPIIDKKSYLNTDKIEDVCLDGRLDDKYLIDKSSGYSGKPYYWPCTREEDVDYPHYMKLAYEQFYQIDKKSTLMIITLALGSWVGGEKISWATREIALRNKIPFTVITPGMNIDEILEIVKYFKDKYEQLVLVGYPPFVKSIIDEGEISGINWKNINLKIGLGGEGYSENWREYIREKIGMNESDLMGIAGGYGAADLGMSVGREYPISILIRKLANEDKSLANDLFGEETIPSLVQYSPSTFYIEEVDRELIFTCMPGIPLVRYNIHDRGGVLDFDKAMKILKSHGYDPIKILYEKGYTEKDIWKLPFMYVFGRSDGTVTLMGAQIYVENIKSALENNVLDKTNTGKFFMKVKFDKSQNPKLIIHIELKEKIEVSDSLTNLYKDKIIDILKEVNSEYKHLYNKDKTLVEPKINLYYYKTQEMFSDSDIKIKYN